MTVKNTSQACIFLLTHFGTYEITALSGCKYFRMEFFLDRYTKVKCTHSTGHEHDPEFVTTHQHEKYDALIYSKEAQECCYEVQRGMNHVGKLLKNFDKTLVHSSTQ